MEWRTRASAEPMLSVTPSGAGAKSFPLALVVSRLFVIVHALVLWKSVAKREEMSELSTKDLGEVYASYAWSRWAAFLKSRYPKGDLTLPQLLTAVASYSRKDSERRKNLRPITLSHDFPHYSVRQLQRLAKVGKIPGAYPTKGGQFRVRRSKALFLWLASGGLSPKPGAVERNLVERDKSIKQVIALGTGSGLDGAHANDPDPLWKTSLAALAVKCLAESQKLLLAKSQRTDKELTACWEAFWRNHDKPVTDAELATATAKAEAIARRGELLAESESDEQMDEERESRVKCAMRLASLGKRLAALVKSQSGASKKEKAQLEIALAIGGMTAAGEKITLAALARKLGISRHTLYRRLPKEIRFQLCGGFYPSRQKNW
jgi:hypothetical protein